MVGPILVNSAHNEVPAQKATIVADTLSWGQRPVAEEPNQAQEATTRENVLLLLGSLAKPQAEDLQKWREAYQEYLKLRIVLQKQHQGKK